MAVHRSYPRTPGFRLGVYVFKDAEIVDFAAPHGVFSVARRFDPELDAFLIADSARPVQAQAGFTVLPNYSFADRPDMDAFLIPGGFGIRGIDGKIGGLALGYFLVMSTIALGIGLLVGNLISPGTGLNLHGDPAAGAKLAEQATDRGDG